jgi:flagellar hook assembly protein FlgD
MEAGNYIITWSGTDDKGNPVSAGVYLYQFRSGQYIKTRKMIYLK